MRTLLAAIAATALLILAPVAGAPAQEGHDHGGPPSNPLQVTLQFAAAKPNDLTVLVGETVTWLNGSVRKHTVTSREGLFDAVLSTARSFQFSFTTAGHHAYYCRIHPFVNGVIEAATILVNGPSHPLLRGDKVMLSGRTLPGPSEVSIERDSGEGFVAVGTAPVAPNGSFAFEDRAQGAASYRAVAGDRVSAPVAITVAAQRTIALRVVAATMGARMSADVDPAAPGETLALQLRLKERFGWWTVKRLRLTTARSRVFTYARHPGARARLVMFAADGATISAVSNVVRLPRPTRRAAARRPPAVDSY
jgi:plastocyanin